MSRCTVLQLAMHGKSIINHLLTCKHLICYSGAAIFSQSFNAYYNASNDCTYPHGILLANIIYQTILLLLFSHFYVTSYHLHGKKLKDSKSSLIITHSNTVANGDLTNLKENKIFPVFMNYHICSQLAIYLLM